MHPTLRLLPVASVLAAAGAMASDSGGPLTPDVPAGQKRGAKALAGGNMQYWGARSDQAKVMTASFLGGPGTEFLCAAGFKSDGSIVLAGNINGGQFELPGAKPVVLGRDGSAPGPAEFGPTNDKALQDRESKNELPNWMRPDTTGFLLFCDPELKTITKAVRLPWTAAAITSMVIGGDGSIYIAGAPGDGFANLGGTQTALSIPADATRKGGHAKRSFIAKLDPDASKVLWAYHGEGLTDAPWIKLTEKGDVYFGAQDLRVFSPAGTQTGQMVVPGGVRDNTSVNPKNGMIARCGDQNTGTGREPWRMPFLDLLKPNGDLFLQLYRWSPRYVVLDSSRLVSDTEVKTVTHDHDGNMLLTCWSDGGNSVANREPTDIRRSPPNQGVGMNAAGANATSLGYLVKLDAEDHQIIGWTMWVSKYAGAANGAKFDRVGEGGDGSVLFSGGSAWGLVQTANKLANGEPAGTFIAVLSPDMTGVRFSSAVPGMGLARIGNEDSRVAMASATINGKTRAIFIGGARAEEDVYELVTRTPTHAAMQDTFGGGHSDGYAVLLDLSAGTPVAKPAAPPRTPMRLLIDQEAVRIRTSPKKPPSKPEAPIPEDGSFVFAADPPGVSWKHADIEVRATDGSHWPNFVSGDGTDGTVAMNKDSGASGTYGATFDTWSADKGDQSRRVLGSLFASGQPPAIAFKATSIGARVTETIKQKDRNGAEFDSALTYQPVTATLTIGSKTVTATFKASFTIGKVVERDYIRLNARAYATFKAEELGLGGSMAGKEVDVRVSVQGIDPATVKAQPKKR